MDRREYVFDPIETTRLALASNQKRIWTALPGIVDKYPGTAGGKLTIDVQPAITGSFLNPDGTSTEVQMPMLLDCPILFQGGGGMTATFPISHGDECLVIFSSRCIDLWWQQGGVKGQAEFRMHSLSDGFALVGVRSQPRAFDLDTENACIVSDDGQTYLKLNPTSKAASMHATGGINLNGLTIDQDGNLSTPGTMAATGSITSDADVVTGTISLKTHTHTNGNNGSPTGAPIP